MRPVHPLLRERGFIAMTAPLEEFCNVVNHHVQNTESSMVGIGTQRTGKTTALRQLERQLKNTGQAAFFGAHVINTEQRDLEPRFWRSFLEKVSTDAHVEVRSNYGAFVNAIRAACDRNDNGRVIIALDEAQKLTRPMYDLLKQLHETLVDLELQPFFLLMAQPDMSLCIDNLRALLRHDIVDRFLAQTYRFRGNRKGELVQLLGHYDLATWPEPLGVSYTQYFAPTQWKHGWRLQMEAEPLWDAFANLAQDIGVDTYELEIGSKYVVKACLTILRAMQESEKGVSHQLLKMAVENSGYAQARRVVGDAEAAARLAVDIAVAARARKPSVRRTGIRV